MEKAKYIPELSKIVCIYPMLYFNVVHALTVILFYVKRRDIWHHLRAFTPFTLILPKIKNPPHILFFYQQLNPDTKKLRSSFLFSFLLCSWCLVSKKKRKRPNISPNFQKWYAYTLCYMLMLSMPLPL